MDTPVILQCTSFADLPALRAGGVVYLVRNGADGGLGNYFAAKGFTVREIVVSDATLDDYCGMAVRRVEEGTRILVAVGNHCAMEAGKLLAHLHDLPLWCVPTDLDAACAMSAYTMWTVDRRPVFLPVRSHTVICLDGLLSPTRDGIQQAYQYLFARYVALHSAVYRGRLFLEERDNARLRTLSEAAEKTLLSIDEYSPTAGKTLWQMLAQTADEGDDNEILLFAKAICVYKKGNMAYNRYVFAAAYAYVVALGECRDLPDLLLPPDRVTVAEAAEGLGWVPAECATPPVREYRRIDWVWRDYLPEMGEVAAKSAEMAKNWRRLAGSAGYGYFEDLSAADLVGLLPLVAETYPTYTPFKHLYLRGGFNLFI